MTNHFLWLSSGTAVQHVEKTMEFSPFCVKDEPGKTATDIFNKKQAGALLPWQYELLIRIYPWGQSIPCLASVRGIAGGGGGGADCSFYSVKGISRALRPLTNLSRWFIIVS